MSHPGKREEIWACSLKLEEGKGEGPGGWCFTELEAAVSISSLCCLHQVPQKSTSEAAWLRRPSGPSSSTASTATSSGAPTTG